MSPNRHLLPLVLLGAVGCSGVSIDTSHDSGTDFARLHTFDYLAGPTDAQTTVRDEILFGALTAELEAKGLQRSSAKPDLLVAVQRTTEGYVSTHGWGYQVRGGRVDRYPVQEGTLVIDLIEPSSRESVWRGKATGVFRFDATPSERREFVSGVLHDMFADFPPGR